MSEPIVPVVPPSPEPTSSGLPPAGSAPKAAPTGPLVITLGLVAMICGLIIVGAYEGTFDAVQENRRLRLERAIRQVIPNAHSIVGYYAQAGGDIVLAASADSGKEPVSDDAVRFHAAYDVHGGFMGIAAEGAAKGYADTVRIMFGYSPECQCITGIGVVSMRETPGIGDKIITDRNFLANFKALDVRLNSELSGLSNEVITVKHGSKTDPWQIDAISGATITSRAVGKAINTAAQALLPRLVPNLEKIRKQP